MKVDKSAQLLATQYNEQGNLYVKKELWKEAADNYLRSLELDPNQWLVYYFIGNCFRLLHCHEQARKYYQQCLAIQPNFIAAQWGNCICSLDQIYSSSEQIDKARETYHKLLKNIYGKILASEEAKVVTLKLAGSCHPFFLPYQGKNDRDLQELYGQALTHAHKWAYPEFANAPHTYQFRKENRKLRIGFATRFFYKHSVWKMPLSGWLKELNRDRFEIFAYLTHHIKDEITDQARSMVDCFVEDLDFEKLAQRILHDNLDVLIFPEIGMDPITIRLAALRLAPIQCNSWGHPETSGMPNIDYFLSSDLMEPEDGQTHYTEKLVRLKNLSIFYNPLPVEPEFLEWQALGINSRAVKYLCCQSLYKYLPQYDYVWSKIATQVPSAQFIFISYTDELSQIFLKRVRQCFIEANLDPEKHIVMLPRMTSAQFAGLCASCNVFLDSLGWSGCNSTFEALEQCLPVVTWPGQFMRSRHSAVILRYLNISSTIAKSVDEYVQIAIRLGLDQDWQKQLRDQIMQSLSSARVDTSSVRDLEKHLESWVSLKTVS